jgi:hypothetical protein
MKPRFPLSHAFRVVPLLLCMVGCTFAGYVPTERVAPTSEVGRQIVNLELGTKVKSELDCPSGQCRLRYRVLVERPGMLQVVVWGPVGEGPESGPRLAQLVLEGPAQNVLGTVFADQGAPLTLQAPVRPGLHFILVQGLGGHLIYELSAMLDADPTVLAEAEPTPVPVLPPGEVAPPEVPVTRVGRGSHAPGDVSDGADFAYDPTVEIKGFRKFAFAQDPQAQLEVEAAPGRTNPFLKRQVQREVRYYLADLGFSQVERDEAQLLFSVNVGSRSNAWYSFGPTVVDRSYDTYFSQWSGHGAHIRQHTYVDGTLVIDIIDTRTGDLVWHGWTTEPVALGEDTGDLLKLVVKSVLDQLGSR